MFRLVNSFKRLSKNYTNLHSLNYKRYYSLENKTIEVNSNDKNNQDDGFSKLLEFACENGDKKSLKILSNCNCYIHSNDIFPKLYSITKEPEIIKLIDKIENIKNKPMIYYLMNHGIDKNILFYRFKSLKMNIPLNKRYEIYILICHIYLCIYGLGIILSLIYCSLFLNDWNIFRIIRNSFLTAVTLTAIILHL